MSALTLLSGCQELIEHIAATCPSDPAESGGITWTPDIGRPVFWGFQDLTTADGAPRDMQIFYPTFEGFTAGPPILKLCLVQWPVVLFLHGQPPRGVSTVGYHRKWFRIASVLARCGFVVVVPSHTALLPVAGKTRAMVAAAEADLNWVRNSWAEAKWVHKNPSFTAVAGHSYGALQAARVAAAHPEFGAFMSLSGPYDELGALSVLSPITVPSFFTWAQGNGPGLPFEDLDGSGKPWDALTQPKYAAVFQGEHFDYLQPSDSGSALRGPCSLVGALAADLAALFISANIDIPLSKTEVAVNLKPPQVQLTPEQEFFAGAHLTGIAAFPTSPGCRLDMRWNVNGVTGSRSLGS